MIKNYFKIAWRNLWKQKGYTFINLAGMAVGMASCFLLVIYVNHEMHYDEHHPNVDRLYRVNYHATFGDNEQIIGAIPAPIAPLMRQDFPQIEEIARLYFRSISIRAVDGNNNFEIDNAVFADSTVQEVFGFEYLQGNPSEALLQPFSIVLTEETAIKVFGNKEVMGKQLLLANKGPFTVKGIVKNLPENTHLDFGFLVPYRNMADVEEDYVRPGIEYVTQRNFLASHSPTYVLLKEGADPEKIDEEMIAFMERYGHEKMIKSQRFKLFPVADIHLAPAPEGTSPMVYLQFFLAIGFLILLIACINFINLSTATYLNRTKEIGVRKVLGAGRKSLIAQFMGETLILSFFAFLLALLAVKFFLPTLSMLVDQKLSFSLVDNWPLTLNFISVFLLAGILAGTYPAIVASRFLPSEIFNNSAGHGSGKPSGWLQKSLITIQFAVGILLICGTLIILSQVDHMRSLPLGFNHDHVISVPLRSQNMNSHFAPGDSTMRARMNAFEDRILAHPNVEAITLGTAMPGLGSVYHPITTDKISIEDNVVLPAVSVDYDYAETFQLEIVAGRDFDESFGSDHLTGFMVNELAVNELNLGSPEEAIGQNISYGGKGGQIVGVVKNYATGGLQSAMESLILDVRPAAFTTFGIRMKNGDLPATLAMLEKTWLEFFPSKAFEYQFFDDSLAEAYENEDQLASLGSHFATIAIFLSCFGLFGLISLTVQQRAKEIGIRKVLGATVTEIVGLLSKRFMKLIGIALLIATPFTWYVMKNWLENFAYRIDLEWWHFAVAGVITLVVAFLTMSFQSIKAARANPVDSLKTE